MTRDISRRSFMAASVAGAGLVANAQNAAAPDKPIQGFDDKGAAPASSKPWTPISDRKIRMGIVGYGVCKFGTQFGLQNHPNVEVVAVSDLFPDRCAELAKLCKCEKSYPSLEELVKDDKVEAVFCATDAAGHCRHAVEVLKHGKHVATAVPAVWGSLEDAQTLYDTVKASGLIYMMFETSAYHDDCFAMRAIYNAGGFGKLIYSEGEYYHYLDKPIDSYKGWRIGCPPLWYPTHSTAYHTAVSGGSFTEVSCLGMPSELVDFKDANNAYKNPFASEIALFRTSEGGMSRMLMCKDTPGHGGEVGRVRGEKGSMAGMNYDGLVDISKLDLSKPQLPPNVDAGGHGGSHGYLGNEFVSSILENRRPLVDIVSALNMTVCGIVAHESAMKGGELLKIPQYKL